MRKAASAAQLPLRLWEILPNNEYFLKIPSSLIRDSNTYTVATYIGLRSFCAPNNYGFVSLKALARRLGTKATNEAGIAKIAEAIKGLHASGVIDSIEDFHLKPTCGFQFHLVDPDTAVDILYQGGSQYTVIFNSDITGYRKVAAQERHLTFVRYLKYLSVLRLHMKPMYDKQSKEYRRTKYKLITHGACKFLTLKKHLGLRAEQVHRVLEAVSTGGAIDWAVYDHHSEFETPMRRVVWINASDDSISYLHEAVATASHPACCELELVDSSVKSFRISSRSHREWEEMERPPYTDGMLEDYDEFGKQVENCGAELPLSHLTLLGEGFEL